MYEGLFLFNSCLKVFINRKSMVYIHQDVVRRLRLTSITHIVLLKRTSTMSQYL